MKKHIAALFVALVSAVLVTASSALAANLVKNPGFEAMCAGGVPCLWQPAGNSIIQSAPIAHTGSGALSVPVSASGTYDAGQCITGLAAGPYDFSYWYIRSTAISVYGELQFYSAPACGSGYLTSPPVLFASSFDTWSQALAHVNAPAGTQSARLYLYAGCNLCEATAAYFDDVYVGAATQTPATFRSLTATRSRRGTLLRWRTASELEVAGFNVFRLEHGRAVKVNRHLIAAKARAGASYRLLDRGHRGARYRLEVVNLDGTRQTRTVR